MPLSPTLLAAIALAIWIYLFLARGNFWQVREEDIQPQTLAIWPRVVAVVPARNEAGSITQTVNSLAKQDYPGEFSIVVVDDHSEDGTGALARKAAAESEAAERITIHSAAALPPGWTGKLWALHEGVQVASEGKPDFLWFTDADVVHAPDTLRRLVFRAEKDSLDLASFMVLLQAKTLPERLLIPPFLYFFLMLYPPRWIADSNASTAGAAGGCILLRRNVLAPIGGMASIRGEVIDDCALARAVKSRGGRIWMGLTRASVSLRSYGSFAEIRDMIARTAFTQLQYSSVLLIGTLAGLFATFPLAWILFFAYPGEAWLLVDTAIALMAATFLATVRFYNLSTVWALTLPLAAVFYGYATCVSAARYWLGRGGNWKGRAQAVRRN
ncbi:MAG TPA: glycosyltransferase [Candidatus Polarisedimenticolia bacterium]|nr:glycosyltransferase [Candidatus Polarisedimenticolia bacterium]